MIYISRNFSRIILLIGLLVYSIISYYQTSYSFVSVSSLWESIILSTLSLLIYCSRKEYNKLFQGQVFTIATIFLLSFVIVHFFNYLSYCLGILGHDFLSMRYVNKASKVSTCALIAILIGLLIPRHPFKGQKTTLSIEIGETLNYFLCLSLVMFVVFTDKRYFSAGGNNLVLNEIGWNPIGAVGNTSCIACIIASVISKIINYRNVHLSLIRYLKIYSFSFYLLTFIYLFLVLISGDRGPLIDVFFSFFLGYILINKAKIKVWVALICIIIGANFLTYLSFLRGNSEDFSLDKISQVNERMGSFREDNNLFFGPVSDLSNVVDAYHLVFEHTEINEPINGIGIGFQLIAVLPGIRSVIYNISGIDIGFLSTDVLATRLLGEDYGAGTTYVADSYYNLGLIGTIILFIVFGMIVRKLDLSLYQDNTRLLFFVIAICYFVKSIYLGRSTIFQPINLIFYTFLYLFLSKWVRMLFYR